MQFKATFVQEVHGIETVEVVVEAKTKAAALEQIYQRNFKRCLPMHQEFERTISMDVPINLEKT